MDRLWALEKAGRQGTPEFGPEPLGGWMGFPGRGGREDTGGIMCADTGETEPQRLPAGGSGGVGQRSEMSAKPVNESTHE